MEKVDEEVDFDLDCREEEGEQVCEVRIKPKNQGQIQEI